MRREAGVAGGWSIGSGAGLQAIDISQCFWTSSHNHTPRQRILARLPKQTGRDAGNSSECRMCSDHWQRATRNDERSRCCNVSMPPFLFTSADIRHHDDNRRSLAGPRCRRIFEVSCIQSIALGLFLLSSLHYSSTDTNYEGSPCSRMRERGAMFHWRRFAGGRFSDW